MDAGAQLLDNLNAPTTCVVCFCPFEGKSEADREGSQMPRVLPCGHTFCTSCLLQLLAPEPNGWMACPTCRQSHLQPPGGVSGIPVNYTLLHVVETAKEAEKDGHCGVHNMTAFSYCKDCEELCCPACLSDEGKHHRHSTQLKEKAAKEVKDRLDMDVKQVLSLLPQLEARQNEVP